MRVLVRSIEKMGSLNIQDVFLPLYGQTFDVSLNWIGNLIRILISGVGVVGVGVILFSLILKGITLPLDIYQRVSMRKQNNRMKENKDRMEKLKKQYANDHRQARGKHGKTAFALHFHNLLVIELFIVRVLFL